MIGLQQPTRADLIAVAREYLGTPFHHEGRLKGIGVDCVGLLICVARDLGLSHRDVTGYPRQPSGGRLRRELHSQLTLLAIADAEPGDIVLMADTQERHVGLLASHPLGMSSLIHADAWRRCVIEHRLDMMWHARIVAAYRFPEFA